MTKKKKKTQYNLSIAVGNDFRKFRIFHHDGRWSHTILWTEREREKAGSTSFFFFSLPTFCIRANFIFTIFFVQIERDLFFCYDFFSPTKKLAIIRSILISNRSYNLGAKKDF